MAIVKVEGMACQHCEGRVKKSLEDIPGITDVTADRIQKEAAFTLKDGADVSDEQIMEAIRRAGFSPIEVIR